MLIADTTTAVEGIGIIGTLVQLGSFGLLCWLAVRILPRIAERYVEAQETTIKAFQGEQRYEREQCQHQFEQIMSVLQENQQAILNRLEGRIK